MVHVGEARYYTPTELASFVVSLLPEMDPNEAIDICSGSWNLLKAVLNRWPSIRLSGVDLDPTSVNHSPLGSQFVHGDGRLFAMECLERGRIFDLVVANPPFGKTQTRYLRRGLAEAVNFQKNFSGLAVTRIETEMLLANAGLVRPGGYLAAIVPSSVVEAASFQDLREYLARQFEVLAIVKLPSNAFPGAEVRSYITIFHRRADSCEGKELTLVYAGTRHGSAWTKDRLGELRTVAVRNGEWGLIRRRKSGRFSDLQTFRGRVSSQSFQESGGIPVLHVAGAPSSGCTWTPTTRFVAPNPALAQLPMAQSGDILVSRVGKAAGYWFMYVGEECLVSDCLIVLRAKDHALLLQYLDKHSSGGCLRQLVKGVTTQYVTESDIRGWLKIKRSKVAHSAGTELA